MILQIADDIGERRIVGGQAFHPRDQRGGDNGKGSALATTGDGQVNAVPLGMAGQKVIRAHTTEVDAAEIVAITMVEPERVVVGKRAGAKRIINRLLPRHRNAVDAHLQRNHAPRRQRRQASIGANTRARHTKQRRVLARSLPLAEHAVEARGGRRHADILQVQVVAINRRVAVFRQERQLGIAVARPR